MRRSIRTMIPAALVALTLTIPSAGALGATKPTIVATIGPSCELEGTADPDTRLTITHTNASGKAKGTYKVTSDEFGEWTADCGGRSLASADRLVFKTRPGGVVLRTFRLPTMSLSANRSTERLQGVVTGDPAPTVLHVGCNPTACSGNVLVVLDPNASGAFSQTMPIDLNGLDLLLMTWTGPKAVVSLVRIVPALTVIKGRGAVAGNAKPGARVTVTFTRGGKVGTFTGTTGPDGVFSGTVRRNGAVMTLKPGDRVRSSIATDLDFVVPAVSVTVGADSVSGTCFPNQRAHVKAIGTDSSTTYLTGTADLTGQFSMPADISPGSTITVSCDPGKGDAVELRVVTP